MQGLDHLSRVLDLISVRGVVSGGAVVSGPWRAQTPVADMLKFFAIVRGEAQLLTDGIDAPIRLVEGEVAILNGRSWLSAWGGAGSGPEIPVPQPSDGAIVRCGDGDPEEADAFIGGRIGLDTAGRELLLDALPAVAHVRTSAASAVRIRSHIHRLFEEITAPLPGAQFAVREYSQLMILDVLRAFASEAEMPDGWLKLLGDEQLRPALDLIHAQPDEAWGLDDLARVTAMSRTSFAIRFRDVAGVPPITYLARWRMLLAKRELQRADTRIRPLAHKLGYSSESAFSSAFKRHVGESPHSYRSRSLRAGSGPPSAHATR